MKLDIYMSASDLLSNTTQHSPNSLVTWNGLLVLQLRKSMTKLLSMAFHYKYLGVFLPLFKTALVSKKKNQTALRVIVKKANEYKIDFSGFSIW